MALGERNPEQAFVWVKTSHLRDHGWRSFHRRLDEILGRAKLDACVQRVCCKDCAPAVGRHSIAPGSIRPWIEPRFGGAEMDSGRADRRRPCPK
jgi:hypothetical protein